MRSNQSMPACTVIPELAYPDVETAATWLCDAFGFTLRLKIGSHRAQLSIGDGAVVLIQLATTGTEKPLVTLASRTRSWWGSQTSPDTTSMPGGKAH
jgi:hypothetical protein